MWLKTPFLVPIYSQNPVVLGKFCQQHRVQREKNFWEM